MTVTLDVNGWTVIDPTYTGGNTTPAQQDGTGYAGAGTRFIYVTNGTGGGTAGNNSDDGSIGTPVLTIANALTKVRTGNPDWLLLKKGDTWTDESFGLLGVSGKSADEPFVITSYGAGITRPLMKIGNTVGIGSSGAFGADYMAIIGIEFTGYTHNPDPAGPYFGSYNAAHLPSGMSFLAPIHWLLIEDCKISFFVTQINIDQSGNASKGNNIAVRRNVIVDGWDNDGHAQGIFTAFVATTLIEENLFDHNGWNLIGSNDGSAVTRNHNIYTTGVEFLGDPASASGPFTIRGNIIANSGSDNSIRSGGIIYNNLWVLNGHCHNIGMPTAETALIDSNVYTEGTDYVAFTGIPAGQVTSTIDCYLGELYDIGPLIYTNNIITHSLVNSGNGYGLSISNGANVAASNNIFYDWQAPLLNNSSGAIKTFTNIVSNSDGSAYPSFTASTNATELTVTAISGGGTPLTPGMGITGTGIAANTFIYNQTSSTEGGGTLGGRGKYTLTTSQTLGSRSMSVTSYHVPLTGGSGSGAYADINVTAGSVSAVSIHLAQNWLYSPGSGYVAGNVLSASVAGVTGFSVTVATVSVVALSGNKLDANANLVDDVNSANYLRAWKDPLRTVGRYAGSVGLTATTAAFLTAARLQANGNWNTALMANAVNNYFRDGFTSFDPTIFMGGSVM